MSSDKKYIVEFSFECPLYNGILNDFGGTIGGNHLDLNDVRMELEDEGLKGEATFVSEESDSDTLISHIIETIANKTESMCRKFPQNIKITLKRVMKNGGIKTVAKY